MPDRMLADWLEAYLRYTLNTEPVKLFHTWCSIGAIAACLQRKVYISYGKDRLYPNMYILLVGPSGKARKGTALNIIQPLLKKAGISFIAQAITPEAFIKHMTEVCTRTKEVGTTDTIDHASVTVFSKEFTVFLKYQNLDLLSDLCDWYDCDDTWVKRTICREQEIVRGVWVNIIGATTPSSLQSALPPDAIGGGFTSRVIHVFSDVSRPAISPFLKVKSKELEVLNYKLTCDMQAIWGMSGEFILTPEAIDSYDDWYLGEDFTRTALKGPKFAGYNSRRQVHVAKLAMILSASHSNDMVIQANDIKRAIEMLCKVEKPMPTVFEGIGLHPLASIQDQVFKFIRDEAMKNSDRRVKPSLIIREFRFDIENSDSGQYSMGTLLATLEGAGMIKIFMFADAPSKNYIQYLGDKK